MRNTMSLHKWHGRAAGLACLPCFSLAEGLTTFNSLLALAIVSAVGLQSQFGRRKMNLVCFSLRFCHNSLILQVTCIPWLSRGEDHMQRSSGSIFQCIISVHRAVTYPEIYYFSGGGGKSKQTIWKEKI